MDSVFLVQRASKLLVSCLVWLASAWTRCKLEVLPQHLAIMISFIALFFASLHIVLWCHRWLNWTRPWAALAQVERSRLWRPDPNEGWHWDAFAWRVSRLLLLSRFAVWTLRSLISSSTLEHTSTPTTQEEPRQPLVKLSLIWMFWARPWEHLLDWGWGLNSAWVCADFSCGISEKEQLKACATWAHRPAGVSKYSLSRSFKSVHCFKELQHKPSCCIAGDSCHIQRVCPWPCSQTSISSRAQTKKTACYPAWKKQPKEDEFLSNLTGVIRKGMLKNGILTVNLT